MCGWLGDGYKAVIFEENGVPVAYALYLEQQEEIYLRQLFVVPERRGCGIGRQAIGILRSEFWLGTKRLTVEVLTANPRALAFWRSVGYTDYSLKLEILPDREETNPKPLTAPPGAAR